MNCTFRLALVSTLALFTACSKTVDATPAPGTPTPAAAPGQTPKADSPAPATNIPKAPNQDAAVMPAGLTPAKAAATDLPSNPTVADLGKLLGSITDGPTATAAKGKLDAVITSLKSAASGAGASSLGGDLTKLAGAAAEKVGVDLPALKAAALKQVEGLLTNDAIKGAIGPTLEQLKTLLK